jgi:hypothetical protein
MKSWAIAAGRREIASALLLLALSLLCGVGCTPARITLSFPDVPFQTAGNSGVKIGVARADDSRDVQMVGTITSFGLTGDLLVGPELSDYIDRKFRNALVERGFVPVDALDPTKSPNTRDYKTLVLRLQIVKIGTYSVNGSSESDAAVGIAADVYAPAGSKEIFAQTFIGEYQSRLGWGPIGVKAGNIMATAADRAIDEALADPAFEHALK